MPSLAIIVPVLDEAALLGARLDALCAQAFDELIVVDGGSRDDSLAIANRCAATEPRLRVISAPAGRARQMNAGARAARAGILLFLHVDTRLPAQAPALIHAAIGAGARWGRFDVRLDTRHPLGGIVARGMNLRAALTGIATGDQAIFVRREVFESSGGFADIPLMEDIEYTRRLRSHGRPARIRTAVVTSARRWERGGFLRTVLMMWYLRLLYWLGVAPHRLARRYRVVR